MTKKIKVLIIEDDKKDFYSISHYLSEIKSVKYDLEWCCDFDLAEKEILEERHDIYLVDYFIGNNEGLEIIQKLRKRKFMKPIILLTSSRATRGEEEAISLGASDFLIKEEIKPETIERSIRYAIDRFHQQQFIRNQERKYRSLFELSIEPFLVLNDKLEIIEFNPSFLEVFDRLDDQLINSGKLSIFQLFKSEVDYDFVMKSLAKEGFLKGFKTILLNQEIEVVSSISFVSLPKYQTTENVFYHVAISDLTLIMAQEKELRKAEKLSMSGRMARMIAHEIRNPLTNIRLALGELTSLTNNEEAIMLNQMIERNTYRISNLIDDLLKSARPQELKKEKVNLKEIIDTAIDLSRDRMELFDVHLEKDIVQEEVFGKWDKEKLEIALVNILTNAIEAMENSKNPVLYLSLKIKNDHPVIRIKDNGKGMDKETLTNLFDPFFSNRKNGLGLGMTATLNIIHMHEGKIDVHSVLGEGTEFEIQL